MAYIATIYRVSAGCGIQGVPAPSVAKAVSSAKVKAGSAFIAGASANGLAPFGADKHAFLHDATIAAISAIRKRKAKIACYSLRDNQSDMTLEVRRL